MIESKQYKCDSNDVTVIHDFIEKRIDAIQCTKCGSRWTVGFGKVTSRFIVKKCGQEMESSPKLLEHDPDAAELPYEVQVPVCLQGLFVHLVLR